jgi:acetate kinase
MSARVLVLNAGSSSLKYQVLDPTTGDALANGLAERVGTPQGKVRHRGPNGQSEWEGDLHDLGVAFDVISTLFEKSGLPLADAEVVAVGHRVVHGGVRFAHPVLVDDEVLAEIRDLATLAPLHNPANANGIEYARNEFPDEPHVAVFDTAFFAELPDAAATYAIDRDVASKFGVRRYGFHGSSHEYVSGLVPSIIGVDGSTLRQIVLHLGNGASASAVRGGHPVDTSMGLTPLEGLVMGTRGGDIDPGALLHLLRVGGLDVDGLDNLLNRQSGIGGLSGVSDMRDLIARREAGDATAALAFDVYIHRLRKYVGAYTAVLGGVDAITFTAGVGENNSVIRAETLNGLDDFGITLDNARNDERSSEPRIVSADESRVKILVVPTNEELQIARHAAGLVSSPLVSSPHRR